MWSSWSVYTACHFPKFLFSFYSITCLQPAWWPKSLICPPLYFVFGNYIGKGRTCWAGDVQFYWPIYRTDKYSLLFVSTPLAYLMCSSETQNYELDNCTRWVSWGWNSSLIPWNSLAMSAKLMMWYRIKCHETLHEISIETVLSIYLIICRWFQKKTQVLLITILFVLWSCLSYFLCVPNYCWMHMKKRRKKNYIMYVVLNTYGWWDN